MIYKKEAPTGKYLTQVAAVADEERIFATQVSGASESLDLDWREATDDEVAAWEACKAEQAKRDAEERAEMDRQIAEQEAQRKAREERAALRRKEQEERDAQIMAAQEVERGESDTEGEE